MPVSEQENLYLSIVCYKDGRLGNQMWQFFSGWAIAKTLGRKFYYNCQRPLIDDIAFMKSLFPKIAGEFEIIYPKNERKVRLLKETQFNEYADPTVFLNMTDKYLRMNINYAQNARFTVRYHDQIRNILEFGANMTDIGEAVVKNLMDKRKMWGLVIWILLILRNVENLLCAHIRQTDFVKRGWGRSYEETFLAIQHVARLEKPRTLFIIGDETKFMAKLVNNLVRNGDVRNDSFHSTFEREVDMYLAKRLCKSFIITTERTTFGFWLAFLMNNDEKVYYLKEYRNNVPHFRDKLPLPWHAIKVEKNTSSLLN